MSTSGGRTDGVVSAGGSTDTMVETRISTEASTPRVRPSVHPVVAIVFVAAVLALVYGLVLRVWLLVELPIWGDEAIVGIMAAPSTAGTSQRSTWVSTTADSNRISWPWA